METEVFVFADLGGSPIPVGRLWARARGNRESASFEYDEGWLSHEERFALEPALKLGPGPLRCVSKGPHQRQICMRCGGGSYSVF